jgi:tetratricopeptide (TPR) repeat protein
MVNGPMGKTRHKRAKESSVAPEGGSRTRASRLSVLAAIGVFSLLIRLLYLWQIRNAPFFTLLMGDSKGYDEWARRIAAGDWIGSDVFYQAPLYPYFMGAIYSVTGHDVLAVRVCQTILGSISCALVADAAWRLFSKRAAIIAGLILALYPPAIFFDGLVQKTALDAFLTSLAIWIISGSLTSPRSTPTWVGLGATMGALSLTRENALILIGVIVVWCVIEKRRPEGRTLPTSGDITGRERPSGRRGIATRQIAAFTFGVALLLLPVGIRNYAVGGGFYLTTSQFGPNFYLGNNARTDGTAGSLIGGRGSSEYERQDAIDIAERATGRTLTPGEVSSYWTGQTLAFIRSQPGSWLKLMLRKVVLLWNSAEAFDTESQESYAEWSPLVGVGALLGNFGLLVPLAAFGVCVTWQDRQRLWVFYALALTYAASVVLFFIYARYRYPLVPFLVLFTSAGLARAAEFLRARSRTELVGVAALVAGMLVFTHVPVLDAADNRAVTEHNLGSALQAEGRIDDAIERYRKAVAIKPDYAPAYSNLGSALLSKGDAAGAIGAYQQALSIDPNFSDAHFNLGNALMREGDPVRAIPHFRRVLSNAPDSIDARTNLGIALTATGQLDDGITELEAAVRLAPKSAIAERALAEVLADRGRGKDAADHFHRAIVLAPDDGEAHYALGRLLLQNRQAAEAVQEFRVALSRPNAPADIHNDLGIALASAGRLDEALAELQLAVKLQPDSLEARNNLAAVTAQIRQRH